MRTPSRACAAPQRATVTKQKGMQESKLLFSSFLSSSRRMPPPPKRNAPSKTAQAYLSPHPHNPPAATHAHAARFAQHAGRMPSRHFSPHLHHTTSPPPTLATTHAHATHTLTMHVSQHFTTHKLVLAHNVNHSLAHTFALAPTRSQAPAPRRVGGGASRTRFLSLPRTSPPTLSPPPLLLLRTGMRPGVSVPLAIALRNMGARTHNARALLTTPSKHTLTYATLHMNPRCHKGTLPSRGSLSPFFLLAKVARLQLLLSARSGM